jgi:hypothetical protein
MWKSLCVSVVAPRVDDSLLKASASETGGAVYVDVEGAGASARIHKFIIY